MRLARCALARPTTSGDEGAVGVEIGEVGRTAQRQGVGDVALEMAVRALDRTVLVGQAPIVARDRHAVMGAQRPVAFGHVLNLVLAQVAEGGRQAVGAVLAGRAAEMPERALQAFGERREALAAEHHPGMGEARPGQPEVVEHVIERPAGDGHAERRHVGEVRQAALAGFVLLAEDHFPVGAVLGAPDADPSLQRAPDAGIEVRMPAHQFLEHADRADRGAVLQDRHHLGLEDIGQGIGTAPSARRALPGREGRIAGEPVSRGAAEARLRGRDVDCVGLLRGHEKPHLANGDVAAGQYLRTPSKKSAGCPPTGRRRQMARDEIMSRGGGRVLQSGYALLPDPAAAPRLILIVVLSHVVCRAAAGGPCPGAGGPRSRSRLAA